MSTTESRVGVLEEEAGPEQRGLLSFLCALQDPAAGHRVPKKVINVKQRCASAVFTE